MRRREFTSLLGGAVAAWPVSASAQHVTSPGLQAATAPGEALAETPYHIIDVGGLDIFYREAGPAGAPVVLLLHGFPTSSRMFRNLIPMLADKYRVVAPDYPAFGHTAVPSRAEFHYTHAHLSQVVEALLEKLGITRFAMYVMDFGGPIGYRLMLKYPIASQALSSRTHRRSESRSVARSGRPSWRTGRTVRRRIVSATDVIDE